MVIVVSLSRDTHKRTKKWREEGKRESSGKEMWKQQKGQEEVNSPRDIYGLDKSTWRNYTVTETRQWHHCLLVSGELMGIQREKHKGKKKKKKKLQVIDDMDTSQRAERMCNAAAVDRCLKALNWLACPSPCNITRGHWRGKSYWQCTPNARDKQVTLRCHVQFAGMWLTSCKKTEYRQDWSQIKHGKVKVTEKQQQQQKNHQRLTASRIMHDNTTQEYSGTGRGEAVRRTYW